MVDFPHSLQSFEPFLDSEQAAALAEHPETYGPSVQPSSPHVSRWQAAQPSAGPPNIPTLRMSASQPANENA